MFGVHKWRSETATIRFVENTQELVAIQLGTLAVLANIFEIPKYLELLHYSPGKLLTLMLCHTILTRLFLVDFFPLRSALDISFAFRLWSTHDDGTRLWRMLNCCQKGFILP